MSSRRRRIVISYPPIRPDEGFFPLSVGPPGDESRMAPTPAERCVADQIRDEIAQQIAGLVAGDPGSLIVAAVTTAADAAELVEMLRGSGKTRAVRIIEIEPEQEDEHQC